MPPHVLSEIIDVKPRPDSDDILVLNASSSGVFSTKSTYELVRRKHNSSMVLQVVWNPMIPGKISFLAWHLLHNFLTLDANLQKRRIPLVS